MTIQLSSQRIRTGISSRCRILGHKNKISVQKDKSKGSLYLIVADLLVVISNKIVSIKVALDQIYLRRIWVVFETYDFFVGNSRPKIPGCKKHTLVFDVRVERDLNMPELQLDKVNGSL